MKKTHLILQIITLASLSLGATSTVRAQISGGILGLDQLDEASFHLRTEHGPKGRSWIRLRGSFLIGVPKAHEFIRKIPRDRSSSTAATAPISSSVPMPPTPSWLSRSFSPADTKARLSPRAWVPRCMPSFVP